MKLRAVATVFVSCLSLTTIAQKKANSKPQQITKEISVPKTAVIHIDNSIFNLELHTWNQNKVKVTANADVLEGENYSNDEWFDKLGISVKAINDRVDIIAKRTGSNVYSFSFSGNDQGFSALLNIDSLMPAKIFKWDSSKFNFNFKIDTFIERKLWKLDSSLNIMQLHLDSLSGTKIYRFDTIINRNGKRDTIRINKFYYSDSSGARMPRQLRELRQPRIEKLQQLQIEGSGVSGARNFNFNTLGKKKTLIIYVPQGAKLDIDNQSSDVIIHDDITDADMNFKNSTLDARKIRRLKLIAKYTTVNAGDIENAEVEFQNGKFIGHNINDLDIESKASSVEYESGNSLVIRSQNDDYTIENLVKLSGRKSYGDLRINKLSGSIDIDGKNADMRVRNFATTVDKINIINRYADIRLPVRTLQNYTVDFTGKFSTVFAPFEKIPVGGNASNASVYTEGDAIYRPSSSSSITRFTGTMGNTSRSHTTFKLTCDQCTVDFK